MFGIPLRYLLKHPVSGVMDLAADPLEALTTIRETYLYGREQRRPQCQYESEDDWERHLHTSLGVEWPCPLTTEFWSLWSKVIKEIEARGIKAGPMSFQGWNDGDAGFVRTIWCLIHHLRPDKVIETGVAHGVTSRIILEALAKNGMGHLWSVDLPPLDRSWRKQVGIAVGDRFADRWSLISGSSRRRLPDLFSRLGQTDLFIHDSLHSERNLRFELDRAWQAVRPGGALIVDDVDANWGFRSFTQTFSGLESMICEAEPLHPDKRRFNQKGLFGIVLKKPAVLASARSKSMSA